MKGDHDPSLPSLWALHFQSRHSLLPPSPPSLACTVTSAFPLLQSLEPLVNEPLSTLCPSPDILPQVFPESHTEPATQLELSSTWQLTSGTEACHTCWLGVPQPVLHADLCSEVSKTHVALRTRKIT